MALSLLQLLLNYVRSIGKKDIERTLEELDKLVRIYGERAEFTQMREVLKNYLNQNCQLRPNNPVANDNVGQLMR